MFPRISHNLGWGVEAHGLGIQQRTGKNARMVALDPGTGIDQERERGGVTFGKPVRPEPFDLGKTAIGKVFVITIVQHALQKALAEIADIAVAPEGGQRPAQAIRLLRGEPRANDGNLHGLFLKERHAKCFAQHPAQFVRGKLHRFFPVAATNIGVHHVALNGPGPDDRHLDHQIIEGARAHARQEVHLRAAFHLKDAHTISLTEHVIDLRILRRQCGQRVIQPMMLL